MFRQLSHYLPPGRNVKVNDYEINQPGGSSSLKVFRLHALIETDILEMERAVLHVMSAIDDGIKPFGIRFI